MQILSAAATVSRPRPSPISIRYATSWLAELFGLPYRWGQARLQDSSSSRSRTKIYNHRRNNNDNKSGVVHLQRGRPSICACGIQRSIDLPCRSVGEGLGLPCSKAVPILGVIRFLRQGDASLYNYVRNVRPNSVELWIYLLDCARSRFDQTPLFLACAAFADHVTRRGAKEEQEET